MSKKNEKENLQRQLIKFPYFCCALTAASFFLYSQFAFVGAPCILVCIVNAIARCLFMHSNLESGAQAQCPSCHFPHLLFSPYIQVGF